MKVILMQDVKGLGKKGDLVNAAEGYARNYLFPRGLAAEANEGTIRSLSEVKKAEKAREERVVKEAMVIRNSLHGKTVPLKVRVGEGGKLFGSITGKDVAEALSKLAGKEIDKKKVELKDAIKALGVYSVTVKLGHDVTAVLEVHVLAQD